MHVTENVAGFVDFRCSARSTAVVDSHPACDHGVPSTISGSFPLGLQSSLKGAVDVSWICHGL